MQKPNRLPILAITLSLSCTAFGCSLQEIPAVGQQCPPDIPNAHASVQFGDIECYANMMESPSLDQNGECANDDFECIQNLKQCVRYQNDFQKLIDSNIGFISFISYDQNTTPYHPESAGEFSNACPAKTPLCVWRYTDANTREKIGSFGCTQCSLTVCGHECIDTQKNANHCGKCYNKCTIYSNCIDGKCRQSDAITCDTGKPGEPGEHLELIGDQMTCVKNTLEHCGNLGESCQNRDGFLKGDCINGKCIDYECKDGFHLKKTENKCEADTSECCGANCIKCDKSTAPYCSNGECTDHCAPGLESCQHPETGEHVCANTKEQSQFCGSCTTPCNPSPQRHSSEVFCRDGICRISQCESNYHLVSDGEGDRCLPDDADNCGRKNASCRVDGWKDGSCIDKKCIPSACTQNYHLDMTNPDEPRCVKDSNDCCGESCTKCTGILKCTNGSCSSTCKSDQETCTDSNHVEYCAILATDTNDCGRCGNVCSPERVLGSSQTACINGECKATYCNPTHFLDNGTCTLNTNEHCGDYSIQCNVENATNSCDTSTTPPKCTFDCHSGFSKSSDGTRCNNVSHCNGINCTQITGWESGDCNNGTCIIEKCKDNFVLKSNRCEPCAPNQSVCNNTCIDTQTNIYNCGSCDNTCSVNKVDNSTSVECKGGQCIATHCDSNSYLQDGKCSKSTPLICGNAKKDCTELEGQLAVLCIDNECVVRSCQEGYILASNRCSKCDSSKPSTCNNQCVNKNTDVKHCGSCGKECKTSDFPHSTSVVCQSGSCRIQSCDNTHYLLNNTCIQSDMNNCGKQGKKCNIDDIYGAMTVDCVNNECVANSCYEGVLQDGYCADEGCHKEMPILCKSSTDTYCCPGKEQFMGCNPDLLNQCEMKLKEAEFEF